MGEDLPEHIHIARQGTGYAALCTRCKRVVAYSDSRRTLQIAAKAHRCSPVIEEFEPQKAR